ncbi:MAG: DNA translocase FtsK [Firmicutes bacterium]|nr:DNA translocase FtsK [Bacillota bacterium]
MGLSLLAFAVLVFFSLFSTGAGALGQLLRRFFRLSLGWGAYLVPFCISLTGVMIQRRERLSNTRVTGIGLLILVLAAFSHLRYPPGEAWALALEGEGGGLLGAVLTLISRTLFGLIGSYIIFATLGLIAALLTTNLSLRSVANGLGAGFKKGRQLLGRLFSRPRATKEGEAVQGTREKKVALPVMVYDDNGDEGEKDQRTTRPLQEEKHPLDIPPVPAEAPHPSLNYQLPPLHILRRNQRKKNPRWQKNITENIRILEETLADFNVDAKVMEVSKGPVITRYELQPSPGTKVSRILSLSDDIALHLAAAGVRIEAPIPGKAAIGIEIPNKEITDVYLREVVETKPFQESPSTLTFGVGKDIAGEPVVADLGKMPHLLIAGATGAGKSVYLNSLLASLLFRAKPDEVKLILIDPKRVELSVYNPLPHLLTPVVFEPQKAAAALCWLVEEMENRYDLFAQRGVRDIGGYNRSLLAKDQADLFLPYIVVIIDELSDLMFVAPGEVEDAICRLAQMARAAGIHLVIATQRPTVDVITGLIKANIPSRISFAVSSQTDSRTILDMGGAEKLLGKGDMLFLPAGRLKPLRVQGAFVSDKEVEKLVCFWQQQAEPEYRKEVLEVELEVKGKTADPDEEDELFPQALDLIVEREQASASMFQRRFRIGYTRAARMIDHMEEKGYIGPPEGSKPRQVLISRERLQKLRKEGAQELSGKKEWG